MRYNQCIGSALVSMRAQIQPFRSKQIRIQKLKNLMRKKNIFLIKIAIYLSLDLLPFFYFYVSFLPGSRSSRPKSTRIRILNTSYNCSATASVSYPSSLGNGFPNGNQGHPWFTPAAESHTVPSRVKQCSTRLQIY